MVVWDCINTKVTETMCNEFVVLFPFENISLKTKGRYEMSDQSNFGSSNQQ